jgi:hypothetical protein
MEWVPAGRGGGGGKPGKITGARPSGRDPEAPQICLCFCIYRFYHFLSFLKINPFNPSSSHSATEGLPDLVQRFVVGPPLLGGRKNFFHWSPNPLSAAQHGVMVEWYWQGKTEVLGEKLVPVFLHSLQIPHGLDWDGTRAFSVKIWFLELDRNSVYELSRKLERTILNFWLFSKACQKILTAGISCCAVCLNCLQRFNC